MPRLIQAVDAQKHIAREKSLQRWFFVMQQKELRDVWSSQVRSVFCVNLQVKVAQEEAQVHARKNLEAEVEVRRARQNAVRSEEERMAMERKVQQVESAMHAQLRYEIMPQEPL